MGNSHVLQSVLTDRSGISVTTRSRVLCPEQTDEASQEGTLNLDATSTDRWRVIINRIHKNAGVGSGRSHGVVGAGQVQGLLGAMDPQQ